MENVQIIDAPRVNGWLDLDSYFIKRLGKEFRDKEDLFNNGLIEIDQNGLSDKFWILSEDGEKLALFKEPTDYEGYESYAELISEEVSKILEIPTAHYDLAKFQGNEGVISYNFIKEYDSYYAGFDIISDFYEQKLMNDKELSELYGIDYDNDSIKEIVEKLNNLEDVWLIFEERYKEHPNKQHIVSKIINGLVNKLIFDILMVNIDDHSDNWGEFDDVEEGKIVAPQFDNARVLNLHKNILIEKFLTKETIEDKELRFTVDNSNIKKPLDVLSHFLNISSSEYTDLVRYKVNALKEHVDEVPIIIETRTESPMPTYLKKYFVTTMHNHLDKVDEIVNTKGKGTK